MWITAIFAVLSWVIRVVLVRLALSMKVRKAQKPDIIGIGARQRVQFEDDPVSGD